MTNRKPWLVMPVLALALGLIIACGGGDDGGDEIPPEQKPDAERWSVWNSSSTATLDYSIAKDGTVTVTVGGKPESHNADKGWNAWRISADYAYTIKADESYAYTFEAWTKTGTRDLHVQYFTDNDDEVYMGGSVPITTTRKTYTIYGEFLPKSGIYALSFQLADQIGTVYIKIKSITERNIGKLTITNFSGKLNQNTYICGENQNLYFGVNPGFDEEDDSFGLGLITIKGNKILIPVWEVDVANKTIVPYTGNKTVGKGDLRLYNLVNDEGVGYENTGDIKFTNGNATINFATQMKKTD